jgi:hypothetical protein
VRARDVRLRMYEHGGTNMRLPRPLAHCPAPVVGGDEARAGGTQPVQQAATTSATRAVRAELGPQRGHQPARPRHFGQVVKSGVDRDLRPFCTLMFPLPAYKPLKERPLEKPSKERLCQDGAWRGQCHTGCCQRWRLPRKVWQVLAARARACRLETRDAFAQMFS